MVPDGTADGCIVKLTRVPAGIESLHRAVGAQRHLRAIDGLGSWRALVPEVIADGSLDGWSFVTERRLPGRPIAPGSGGPSGTAASLRNALAAIATLHQATSGPVDPGVIRATWLDRRIERVAQLIATGLAGRAAADGAERQLAELADELGPTVDTARSAGWIHGDLWSENVLVDATGAVCGLVDWDSAAPGELPDHDTIHLVLYARKQRERRPLGRVLAEVLRTGWTATDRELVDQMTSSDLDERAGLWLYWLRLVEVNLRRQPGLADSATWLSHNVGAVLACR